ncbi:MAG: amino acid adenylation domain-containing protein, partial [Cyanobacteria bacterium P01_F01_bin.4]
MTTPRPQADTLDDATHNLPEFSPFAKDEIEQSVGRRFEKQVAKYPDHLAIKSRTHTLTYSQLNQLANQSARAILAMPGDRTQPVIIFLEQGALFIATFLATLKAGRCAVPVDPTFPASRNSKIIDDSQASLIVTHSDNLAEANAQLPDSCTLLNLDELDSTLSKENLADGLEAAVSPDTVAYVLYTSGSTGKPKGVYQNHRNLLHFIRHQVNSLKISPSDRTTMLYSCSVNGALRGILYTLLNGATLCPFNVKREGLTNLIHWLIEEKITIYHSVTTLFRHMTSVLSEANPFPQVRMVILGGEAVSAEDVALYKKIFSPHCLLYTGLGATETGTIREYIVNKQTTVEGSRMPLGYGVEDRDIMLWDEAGQAVGPGQVGEICVRSPYLALGYWQNPEKTRQAFLPDPDGGERRIYRTGDLGKFLPDGCLVHQGRTDFQVKIRGYRVELSEIELALVRHDSVKEVVVVGRADPMGAQRLIAYVVPVSMPDRFPYQQAGWLHLPDRDQPLALTTEDIALDSVGMIGITEHCQAGDTVSLELVLPGQVRPITLPGQITQRQDPRARIQFEALAASDLDALSEGIDYLCEQAGRFRFSESTLVGNLRSQVRQQLPDYMVPSAFVLLDSLPLTANGKVNRKALPDPPTDQNPSTSTPVAPTTLTQKALANIWQQVLVRSHISIEDNFFELGGHSLLAAQIVARIQTVCQVDLPLSALFETPTIRELADAIDQRVGQSGSALPPIMARQVSDVAPLSFAQQRLWFLQQLEPESSAYHITRTFQLQGPLQVE